MVRPGSTPRTNPYAGGGNASGGNQRSGRSSYSSSSGGGANAGRVEQLVDQTLSYYRSGKMNEAKATFAQAESLDYGLAHQLKENKMRSGR